MPTNVWGRAYSRPGVFNSLFACLVFLLPVSVSASSPLVIGEVNWAGSSHSNADEWVELWNTSSEERSLAGWSLEGASGQPIIFPETAVVPAHGTFILSNYDETHPKSTLNTPAQLVTTDVALSNETLHLILKDTQGIVMDEAGDGTRPPAGMTRPFTSMLRSDPLVNTWTNSTSSHGLDPEVSDLGTPGICDGCTRIEEVPTDSQPPSHTESPPEESLPTIDTSSTSPVIPELSIPEEETTSTVPVTNEPEIVPDEPVFTDTTSTEPEVIPEPVDPELSSPSSTIELPEEEIIPSTTSTEVIPEIETACAWQLSTLLPAPSDGQERVTITGCNDIDDLFGLVLRDTQGIILTVTSSTPYLFTNDQDWQLTLPSQRLNNGGDSVLLYAADGRLLDSVSYPPVQHDEHYARREDGTWWIPERAPPPSPVVTVTPSASPASSATTSPPVPTPTSPTSSTTTSTITTVKKRSVTSTIAYVSTSSTKKVAISVKKVTSMSWAEYTASKTRSSTPSSKATVAKAKKVSTATKPTVKKTTTSMTASSATAPRVLLHGTVGTPPNLIAKRRFVLLNADGTGLLVYGSTSQPSPPLGSSIAIYGTLITNDEGTHLEMRARDRWELTKTALASPKITSVDLLSVEPSQAWSLTELTGRVLSRGTTSARIETHEMELTVALPTILGYRAQRLQIGDVIRVRGVLDLRGATPQLYPRTPVEITIIEPKTNTAASAPAKPSNLPPWAPMSAAATTIAGGYGFMRWRAWHKQKQLERQLTLAIDQLPS